MNTTYICVPIEYLEILVKQEELSKSEEITYDNAVQYIQDELKKAKK